MSPRTLQNWLEAPQGKPQVKLGRPSYPAQRVQRARRAVWRVMQRLGSASSWRAVARELGSRFPLRLLQRLVACFKREIARRHRAHLEAQRVHVEVLERDALWAQDATFLGRDEHGEKVWAETIREVACAEMVHAEVGAELTGEQVREQLEQVRRERGTLPLVLSTDNGPPYTSETLERYLEQNQVVHLKSLPHTPQHNPFAERGNGELKHVLGISKENPAHGIPCSAWRTLVTNACRVLNFCVPRPSRGGKTAAQCSQELRSEYDSQRRARFYAAACEARARALQEAAERCAGARARRRLQREAILVTMEQFSLIRRTRGGALLEASRHAIIS